jgi:serine-type D-Ala-D-Ala carboxypeptidase/endopeptidase (penicillin-binding protein 4)
MKSRDCLTLPCARQWLVALLFFSLALSGGQATAAAGRPDELPPPVARALADAQISPSGVAIVVQEAGAKKPRLAVNADLPMNPASVMKLVTTYVALEALGPAHTWQTEAYAAGKVENGILAGDLHIKGSGDPKLTLEPFWLLLRELRARGVRDIRGDLVLDRSRFATAFRDPGAFDGEPYAAYNVGPDALLLNFKAIRFRFVPDPRSGGRPTVLPEPLPAGLDVVNTVTASGGSCGDWKDDIHADLTRVGGGASRLVLSGTYATACGEQVLSLGLLDHPDYVLGVFRQIWAELGGTMSGGMRDGPVPAGASLLATAESPPLADLVRDINKFSNNVMARQLFLTLGAEAGRLPARESDGAAAVRAWLASHGLATPELVMENGAGLSRTERISAAGLERLLVAAYRSAVMPEFVSSLPVVAVDGTMKKRLAGRAIAGRAHIKGGTLQGVRTVAGYVLDKAGRMQVVVFFVNDTHAGAAVRPAQDALLQWVYDGQ